MEAPEHGVNGEITGNFMKCMTQELAENLNLKIMMTTAVAILGKLGVLKTITTIQVPIVVMMTVEHKELQFAFMNQLIGEYMIIGSGVMNMNGEHVENTTGRAGTKIAVVSFGKLGVPMAMTIIQVQFAMKLMSILGREDTVCASRMDNMCRVVLSLGRLLLELQLFFRLLLLLSERIEMNNMFKLNLILVC